MPFVQFRAFFLHPVLHPRGGYYAVNFKPKRKRCSMNNKLAKLVSFVSKIDRRYIQFAHLALALFVAIVVQGPLDGSIGPVR